MRGSVDTMMVTYTGDATYVYLTDVQPPVARTVSLSGLVMVDLDVDGQPVGVEFAVPPAKITDGMLHRVADRFPDQFKDLAANRSWLLAHA
jgi:uncharacterized protein YuzE